MTQLRGVVTKANANSHCTNSHGNDDTGKAHGHVAGDDTLLETGAEILSLNCYCGRRRRRIMAIISRRTNPDATTVWSSPVLGKEPLLSAYLIYHHRVRHCKPRFFCILDTETYLRLVDT